MRNALILLSGSAALSLFALTSNAAPASPKQRPNIVILVSDDWGFTDVGAFGGEIATPNIDALARRGMRFSNFHVAASCSPTRSMLLTGVDNHRNGIGNLMEAMPREHQGKPGYQGSLNERVVTVSSLLQDHGYRTYITGKWNVGSEPQNLPPRRGFDRSIIQGDTGSDNWDTAQRYLPHSDKVYWFEDGKTPVMPREYYSSQYFVDRMLGYLQADAQSEKPFLAYIGFQANHAPIQAPAEFIAKYKGRYNAGWTALRQTRRDRAAAMGLVPAGTPMVSMGSTPDWQTLDAATQRYEARRMEVYAAMAEAMDHHVGRLIAQLKASGAYDNTVFVFLSDNGAEASDYKDAQLWLHTQYTQDIDQLGARGAFSIEGPGWASASSSPLNTYKFYAGEGGIRTPLIISGLAGMPQNQIHPGLTHVTDIAPTLLELAGIAPHNGQYKGLNVEPMAGHSLLPVLSGQTTPVRQADEVLGYELSGNAALFKGHLKLLRNLPPVGDGQWHLFDLSVDPGETHDLQTALPMPFQEMQVAYQAWAHSHGVLPMPDNYSPTRQVMINSIFHYWLPTYGPTGLAIAAGLLGLLLGRTWQRRRTPLRTGRRSGHQ